MNSPRPSTQLSEMWVRLRLKPHGFQPASELLGKLWGNRGAGNNDRARGHCCRSPLVAEQDRISLLRIDHNDDQRFYTRPECGRRVCPMSPGLGVFATASGRTSQAWTSNPARSTNWAIPI